MPKNFCSDIMTPHYRNTVLIAHNAKGFDSYPILKALIDYHSVKTDKILYSGSKVMMFHVTKKLDLKFLDTLNFLGMKLSKIPKCFDLEEMSKGYFPHLFNTTDNQTYVGPYPDIECYGVDYMSADDKKSFMEWYATKKHHETFDFKKEMYEYCVSDVDILRRGCMKFRQMMMEATAKTSLNDKGEPVVVDKGIDPFDHVTITSACQAISRHLFLEEEYETEVKNVTTKQKLVFAPSSNTTERQPKSSYRAANGRQGNPSMATNTRLERPFSSRVRLP